jgi:hypothetical protein
MASSNSTTPAFPPGYAEENNGNMLLIPCAVFTALVPIFVGIRIWARVSMTGMPQIEDWTLLFALVYLLLLYNVVLGTVLTKI